MKAIAEGLSDQQIADVAAYYAARGAQTATAANK
jgi:cytochrome c553